MIAGLPWESWLLLLLSVGVGLAFEIAFFQAHRTASDERRDRSGGSRRSGREGDEPGR